MPKWELHPSAKESLNKLANGLVAKIGPRPTDETYQEPSPFPVDRHAIANVEVSGPVQVSGGDTFGRRTSRGVVDDTGELGLYGQSYAELTLLAEKLQDSARLGNKVSVEFLAERIFSWAFACHRSELKNRTKESANHDESGRVENGAAMTEHVLRECKEAVRKFEITIPVNSLLIESDFDFGNVRFKTVQRSLFDEIDNALMGHDVDEETRQIVTTWSNKTRSEFQGRAAITMFLEAEPTYARELALTEAERSLALLRIYHPAHAASEVTAHCTLRGHEHVKTTFAFVREGDRVPSVHQSVVSDTPADWGISQIELAGCRRHGLDAIGRVLARSDRSKFETRAIKALALYSEGVLKQTITERLLYYFVALESILLKDSNESIQKNIGDRLAFYLETEEKERRAIAKNVLDVYKARSRFIHHGHQIEYDEMLDDFCENLQLFFWKGRINNRAISNRSGVPGSH